MYGELANVGVFIAQLVEHCSMNAQAMGSNPVEPLKILFFFFFGLIRNCLNCDSPKMVTSSFQSTRYIDIFQTETRVKFTKVMLGHERM